MAIAYDTASTSNTGAATSLTWSHTCTGSNLFLIVGIAKGGSGAFSGITYNGVAMTQLSGVGDDSNRWYGLANADSGTHDIVASWSDSVNALGVAASYTGVNTSTPYDGLQSSATLTSPTSVTVTSASGNLVLSGCSMAHTNSGGTLTTDVGQTERTNVAFNIYDAVVSDEAGDTSVTVGYTSNVTATYSKATWGLNLIAASASTLGIPIAMYHYTKNIGA